jgi:hypothetical protein
MFDRHSGAQLLLPEKPRSPDNCVALYHAQGTFLPVNFGAFRLAVGSTSALPNEQRRGGTNGCTMKAWLLGAEAEADDGRALGCA